MSGSGFRLQLPDSYCGIYHLIRGGRVIYVGQTTNVLSRVASHHLRRCADEVAFYPCRPEELDARELADIERLQPDENRAGKHAPHYPPGWPRDEFLTERALRRRLTTRARLTDSLVAEARRRVSAGADLESLAVELGVSVTTIRHAVSGQTWAHVPEPAARAAA